MRYIFKKVLVLLSIILLLAGVCGCDYIFDFFTEDTTATTAVSSSSVSSREETADTTAATTEATTEATTAATTASSAATTEETTAAIDENGTYTQKDDVALYIYTYGHLPSNFMTKKQAKELGWSSGGLDKYQYGACIGGDRFGNYEGILPEKDGRKYFECDIDTMHRKSRGAKRIVYSSDGLIYYTEDHYSTFELLYGAGV